MERRGKKKKVDVSRGGSVGIAGLGLTIAVVAAPMWAQKQPTERERNTSNVRYTVKDLGTLPGGTSSYATFITRNRLISGHASSPNGAWNAVLWQNELIKDIGTPGLGGQNSAAFGVNEWNQASGEAETAILDPNGEDFCGFKALGLPS